jgi:hypothetical protein
MTEPLKKAFRRMRDQTRELTAERDRYKACLRKIELLPYVKGPRIEAWRTEALALLAKADTP